MSSSMYRSQLERKRSQRVHAEKRAATARTKESDKRAAGAKSRASASKASSDSTRRSREREAERFESEANSAGKDAAAWQTKASGYLREEVSIQKRLADAEDAERKAADSRREQQAARDERERKASLSRSEAKETAFHRRLESRLTDHDRAIQQLRQPQVERLRVLMLTASGEGDLRVGREQKRIQDAVRFASRRDSVTLDVRPAATGEDLLNGLTQGRPHVVHFSGHGNEAVVVFEEDVDAPNPGAVVTSDSLSRALAAVDESPLLVVLNACATAPQAARLVDGIAHFAIGHSASIDDGDAIAYAARFYAAIADGQSIQAAHDVACAALAMSGTPGADLPQLYADHDLDPAQVRLVLGPLDE